MIRVSIDLFSAVTGAKSTIGTMYITNDASGSQDRGNYDVAVARRGYPLVKELFDHEESHAAPAARLGKVTDYPRQAYNVWRLIARAVLSAFPEEIKTKPGKAYKSTLTAQVMRGLDLMKVITLQQRVTSNEDPVTEDDADITAAIEWIGAAEDNDKEQP